VARPLAPARAAERRARPGGGIDLDAVVAIDVHTHTHAEVSAVTGRGSLAPELERAADNAARLLGLCEG
jgi:hypothetical protein